MVAMDPSWPVFMACSMSITSAPRTSPTTTRSGRMRRLLRISSRMVTAPLPSPPLARLQPHDVRMVQRQFGGVLHRHHALGFGMKNASAFSSEVLPELAPPDTRILQRCFTASLSSRW